MQHKIETESETVELSTGDITVHLLVVNDVHIGTFDHDFLAESAAFNLKVALNK